MQMEDVLPAKELTTYMQALAKEAQVQLAAQGVTAGSELILEWQGRKLSVKPDRLKAAISHMQTLAAQLDGNAAAGGNAMDVEGAASSEAYHQQCGLYHKVLKALADARAAAAHAIKSSNGECLAACTHTTYAICMPARTGVWCRDSPSPSHHDGVT